MMRRGLWKYYCIEILSVGITLLNQIGLREMKSPKETESIKIVEQNKIFKVITMIKSKEMCRGNPLWVGDMHE